MPYKPDRVHLPRAAKQQKIVEALRALHNLGAPEAGPADIARQINEDWCLTRGTEPSASTVSGLLRDLVARGQVLRVAAGPYRGRYRLPTRF